MDCLGKSFGAHPPTGSLAAGRPLFGRPESWDDGYSYCQEHFRRRHTWSATGLQRASSSSVYLHSTFLTSVSGVPHAEPAATGAAPDGLGDDLLSFRAAGREDLTFLASIFGAAGSAKAGLGPDLPPLLDASREDLRDTLLANNLAAHPAGVAPTSMAGHPRALLDGSGDASRRELQSTMLATVLGGHPAGLAATGLGGDPCPLPRASEEDLNNTTFTKLLGARPACPSQDHVAEDQISLGGNLHSFPASSARRENLSDTFLPGICIAGGGGFHSACLASILGVCFAGDAEAGLGQYLCTLPDNAVLANIYAEGSAKAGLGPDLRRVRDASRKHIHDTLLGDLLGAAGVAATGVGGDLCSLPNVSMEDSDITIVSNILAANIFPCSLDAAGVAPAGVGGDLRPLPNASGEKLPNIFPSILGAAGSAKAGLGPDLPPLLDASREDLRDTLLANNLAAHPAGVAPTSMAGHPRALLDGSGDASRRELQSTMLATVLGGHPAGLAATGLGGDPCPLPRASEEDLNNTTFTKLLGARPACPSQDHVAEDQISLGGNLHSFPASSARRENLSDTFLPGICVAGGGGFHSACLASILGVCFAGDAEAGLGQYLCTLPDNAVLANIYAEGSAKAGLGPDLRKVRDASRKHIHDTLLGDLLGAAGVAATGMGGDLRSLPNVSREDSDITIVSNILAANIFPCSLDAAGVAPAGVGGDLRPLPNASGEKLPNICPSILGAAASAKAGLGPDLPPLLDASREDLRDTLLADILCAAGVAPTGVGGDIHPFPDASREDSDGYITFV